MTSRVVSTDMGISLELIWVGAFGLLYVWWFIKLGFVGIDLTRRFFWLLIVADLAAGDHDPSASVEALEHELARLRAELQEYQGLIDELPEIYEAKFTHQLRDVAQDVRRLMDERQALQEQINRCLEAGAAMPLLAAAPEPPPTPARPRLSPAALAAARRWLNRQPGWRLGLMAGTAAFALAIAAGLRWRPAPVSAPQLDVAAQAVAPGAQPPPNRCRQHRNRLSNLSCVCGPAVKPGWRCRPWRGR